VQNDRGTITTRPAIAIISNSQTPYRLHLHQRIARELPMIRLWSIFTHEISNAPWSFTAAPEIGPVLLGKGESATEQSALRNSLKEWRRGKQVIRFLIENQVRAVVMMGYNDLGRVRVMRWCRRHGVVCFLFGDSNIRGDRATGIKGGGKSIAKRLFVRRVLSWCDGALACGTLGQAYFNKYGVASDRIFFFPYEPDYALIQSIDAARIAEVAQHFKLGHERRRLIYTGRLVDVKRVDLLIDAFIAMARQRADWDLVIVGDGPLREPLQARAPAWLTGRITWTGFLDDQETVSALYRSCDLLVLPSDNEPWALVINEAAAAGLAIVSSDVVGASAELVREGVNGRLFPAGNLDKLIAALLDATDPGKIDQLKSGSAMVLSEWRQRGDPVAGLRQALAFAKVV
jgi:glycosyltransferase involved in cell wall biosynthesis